MDSDKSKRIAIIILVIALFLGLAGAALSFYLNRDNDQTNTNNLNTNLATYSCQDIALLDVNGAPIDSSSSIDPTMQLQVVATFLAPLDGKNAQATNFFNNFEFSFNADEKTSIQSDQIQYIQTTSTTTQGSFKVTTPVLIPELASTLSIIAQATNVDGQSITSANCNQTYPINREIEDLADTQGQNDNDVNTPGTVEDEQDGSSSDSNESDDDDTTLDLTDNESFTSEIVDTDGDSESQEITNDDESINQEIPTSLTISLNQAPVCVSNQTLNSSLQTLTIINNGEINEDISKVTIKVPQGNKIDTSSITVAGAKFNGNVIDISTGVTGGSELIFGESDFIVPSKATLTLTYSVSATSGSAIGEGLQEIVITPGNTNDDLSRLRAENTITTAQNCSSPDTGIFDESITVLVLSIIIMILSIFFYYSNTNNSIATYSAGKTTSIIDNFKLFRLNHSNRREHNEKSFRRKK